VPAENVTWHPPALTRAERWAALGVEGATVWFTGLSGSGKSTVAVELERLLVADGRATCLLDGDNLRHGLNRDLGFSPQDREENVRRCGEVALLLNDSGVVAIVPLISPYRRDRDRVRELHDRAGCRFLEVFVDTPLAECERRDPKGLYARARAGELTGFTGIDDPYEPPAAADLVLPGADTDPASLAAIVADALGAPRPGR
jgi:bifunctional enzyme CysN/CysC